MRRFSGAPTLSQKRLPLNAWVSPRSRVPSNRILPAAPTRLTITFDGPLIAVISRYAPGSATRCGVVCRFTVFVATCPLPETFQALITTTDPSVGQLRPQVEDAVEAERECSRHGDVEPGEREESGRPDDAHARAAHTPLEPRAGAAVGGERQERQDEGGRHRHVDRVQQRDPRREGRGRPGGRDREQRERAEHRADTGGAGSPTA